MSAAVKASPRILLGAMSGTSADGVDVAAVEITGRGLAMQARYLGHVEYAYDPDLRRQIFAIRESGAARLEDLAGLGRRITLAYSAAVRRLLGELSLQTGQVQGLAAHGQTLFHAPPDSIQWLDPSLLAAETDLAVVSDFRRADLAAGGQGAPLVPFADWILFRHPQKTRVILNIGGIANLTYLPAGGGIDDVIAFDTGPGCCIIDSICRSRLNKPYDDGGRMAADGKIPVSMSRIPIVSEFVSHPYFFDQLPPKSTDTGQMLDLWERSVAASSEASGLATADLLALAVLTTALTIGAGLSARLYPERIMRMSGDTIDYVVAGGGVRNLELLKQIEHTMAAQADACKQWPPPKLLQTDGFGLPSQAREAVAFAILGAATLDGEPSNVPSATGARRRVVLGSITPRPGGP